MCMYMMTKDEVWHTLGAHTPNLSHCSPSASPIRIMLKFRQHEPPSARGAAMALLHTCIYVHVTEHHRISKGQVTLF